LAAAVFLEVTAFFTAFFAVEVYFLVVAVGLAGLVLAVVDPPSRLVAVFFAAEGFVTGALGFVVTGFVAADLLETGLVFLGKKSDKQGRSTDGNRQTSLVASVRALGANLTLPEGPDKVDRVQEIQMSRISVPFGRRNVPFSLPVVIARFSWLEAAALTSIPYLDSTN
jgi:hypothetical protein